MNIESCLIELSCSAREFYVPSEVQRVGSLNSLEFLRDYVSKNIPIIFTDIATNWKATKEWNTSYLLDKIGDTDVTVSQTPNGRADSVIRFPAGSPPYPVLDETGNSITDTKALFVMPHDKTMKFSSFVELLQSADDSTVHYIQYQNSNFTSQFHNLHEDIDTSCLQFAKEAFGCEAEATNFWMGDSRSVSSLHKDHYENMYTVIRGTKKFLLFPPTDRPFLRHETLRSASFRPMSTSLDQNTENFGLVDISEDSSVPWIVVDPENPDLAKFPEFANAKAIYCEVHEGETLYLPSLFYHQVSQEVDDEGIVVAINSWFDMQYDIKYNYFTLLQRLSN